MNNPEDPKLQAPSLFKMISSFAKDLTTYVQQGAPNVTTKDYVQRLEACNNCEHILKPQMRCGLCGCLLEHKAKWKTTTCPDKPERWKKQILDVQRQENNNTDISNKA